MPTDDLENLVPPEQEIEPALEELLAAVTRENLHPEVDSGYAVGKEGEGT